jgi:hypothetical protein
MGREIKEEGKEKKREGKKPVNEALLVSPKETLAVTANCLLGGEGVHAFIINGCIVSSIRGFARSAMFDGRISLPGPCFHVIVQNLYYCEIDFTVVLLQ